MEANNFESKHVATSALSSSSRK
jgi:hypothetical protein